MKKIKVFHLITELERGGAEILLLDLLRHLREEKFEAHVGYLRGEGTLVPEFKKIGIEAHYLKMCSNFDLGCLMRLIKLLKAIGSDILHTHLITADIYGYFAAKISNTPVVISTKHNTDDFRKKKILPVMLDIIIANNIEKIIAVSRAVKDFLIKYEKISENKITVIYNGIDTDKFAPIKDKTAAKVSLNLPAQDYVVGMIARFNEQKGHKYLIEAIPQIIKKIQNIHFVFVGDGPLRELIEKKARELRITGKTTFLGVRDDIPEILNSFDLFVLPSLWEGLGIVLLEAQSMGLPIIASRVDGITEALEEGKTGILVPAGDSGALAEVISGLILNKEKMKYLGSNARQFVKDNFSIQAMSENIKSLYSSCAQSPQSGIATQLDCGFIRQK